MYVKLNIQRSFDLKEAVGYLKEMIRIPSITGSEGALGDYITQKLYSFGIKDVEQQEVSQGRFNVIARINGKKPGQTTLLTGHMDTVREGKGWNTNPFEPVQIDDRIYGRGSNDMKAGIAVILTVARIACENREELPGNIVIALVVDEEAYSTGVIKLVKEEIKADFGLSAEPEFESIIVGAAGKVLTCVEVTGLKAHGSTPQDGINAVEDAARFIAELDSLSLPTHKKIKQQPYVTLCIDGGAKEYSIDVPDKCSILINKHTVPGETHEMVIDSLTVLKEKLGLKSKFKFIVKNPFYPSYVIDENHPEIRRLQDCYRRVVGKDANLGYDDGVSDNNYLVSKVGIPTVCLGPTGGGMHASNEWVSIDEISMVGEIYLHYLFAL